MAHLKPKIFNEADDDVDSPRLKKSLNKPLEGKVQY